MWVSLILLVVSFVLQELLRPKIRQEDARPSGLGDLRFPTATEGRAEPVVFGRVMLEAPNVVWYDDLFLYPITKYIRQNLWSGERVTLGYKFYVGVQAGICRGPVDTIDRAWVGERLVFTAGFLVPGSRTTGFAFDDENFYGGDSTGNGGLKAAFTFYLGYDDQPANEYLAKFQSPGGDLLKQSTYAGSCYVVVNNFDSANVLHLSPTYTAPVIGGAYLGNSATIQPWKFEVSRYPALFPGQTLSSERVVGVDAGMINVLYELLTNKEWGFGYAPSTIDTGVGSSFVTAADTLRAESNGFSFVLGAYLSAEDLRREIERQMDGIVFFNYAVGKWVVRLIRADYVLASTKELTPANILSMSSFVQGTWAGTANQVKVEFTNRANDYKTSTSLAQDTANMLMQGGGTFSTLKVTPINPKFPGVMDAANAARIASRELRAQARPLASATVEVNRELYDVTVGDVVRLTLPHLGISQLAMRVLRLGEGNPESNRVTLQLVQDVFATYAASFGVPPTTGWLPPSASLHAYPVADQLAIEAPRAILVRDPNFNGDATASKIWAAVRLSSSGEVSAQISQRNAAGVPSGVYTSCGSINGYMLIGTLFSAMPAAAVNPTTAVLLVPDPDFQETLLSVFEPNTALSEMGSDLVQLILVDEEFMLVRTAVAAGADVSLQTVYRGVLDSVQSSHAASARVFLVFTGANLSNIALPNTNQVDVQLRPQSLSGVFAGAPNTINFTMAKRPMRPYPPAAPLYNGSGVPWQTPSLEGAGSGLGGFRIDVSWWRRHFQTADELISVTHDDPATDAGTTYRLEVRADPLGANTLVAPVSAWTLGQGPIAVSRADILTAAPAGTLLRVLLRARHDFGTEVDLQSRYDMAHDVTPVSTTTGSFYFGGGLAANVASASYTAVATGTFTLAIGVAQTTALIEVSLNGGAFAAVIAAGLTSGTLAVTSGDAVRVRRTANEAPHPNYVELRNPGGGIVAYGTFKT